MAIKVVKGECVETAIDCKNNESGKTKSSELNSILAQIKKDKGNLVATSGKEVPKVSRLPTGIFEFDLAIGGGFPRGRYSVLYGPESSGKTAHAYCAVAQAQKLPPPCNKVVWVDLEGTYEEGWASQFGIDTEELIVVRPSYGEEAVDLVDALVRAEDVALLVVDSVAVLVASKEVEQSTEKADVGTSALLIKRMCNKLVIALSTESKRGHEPAVILINQTRYKIGVMFGDPEVMPGGNTIRFLSSLTVRLSAKNKMDSSVSSEIPAYKETKAVIKKAKVGVNKYNTEYDLAVIPQPGIAVGETNAWNTILSYLKNLDLITKNPKKGWDFQGETYNTLSEIQQRYLEEWDFQQELKKIVIDSMAGKVFLVEDNK